MKYVSVILAIVLMAATCRSQRGNKDQPFNDDDIVVMDTVDISPRSKEWTGPGEILPADYRATAEKTWNLVHTDLYVAFDFDRRRLNGEARLKLELQFYPTDSVVLDAKHMFIENVWLVSGREKGLLSYRYDDSQQLVIKLPEIFRMAANGSKPRIELHIGYTARPYESNTGGSTAITDDRGLYFINHDLADPSKPRQIWTQGETQSNSRWFPTIDAPNQKMTHSIAMTVPDTMVTLSNGLLTGNQKNGDGTRTDFWEQKLPHAPYLVMMAVGNWAEIRDQWRGKPVSYLVEKPYAPYARMIFGETPAMMEFFSTYTGVDYAWEKYSQVVVRDFVSGAMENTSATVHMGELQHTRRQHIDETYEDYVSHELFHHWFGDLVTTESWSNITLNESFATYGEYLWRDRRYGRDKADEILQEFRDYYKFISRFGGEAKLVRYDYHSREDVFDIISYQKGALILHMLRNAIGDEAFRAGIRLYLSRHAYQAAEVAQLRLAFEEVTGRDLNWFFNQWYFDEKQPEISLTPEWDESSGTWSLDIDQTQEHRNTYTLPVTIRYSVQGKVAEHRMVIDQRHAMLKLNTGVRPDWWIFDAENDVLAETRINTPNIDELTALFRELNKSWTLSTEAGLKHRIWQTALDLYETNQGSMEPEQNMLIRQAFEPMLMLALNSTWKPTLMSAHQTAREYCGDDLQLWQKVSPAISRCANDRLIASSARESALRTLVAYSWNQDSLYRFTRDSSIDVAGYAISMQQKTGPWVNFARETGINDPEREIAVRWAAQLMHLETDFKADVKILTLLTKNPGAGVEGFMKAFGEFLQMTEEQTLATGIRELGKHFENERNYTLLRAMAYRLTRLEKLTTMKRNEARESGQEPDVWITDLLKAIAEIREAAATNK